MTSILDLWGKRPQKYLRALDSRLSYYPLQNMRLVIIVYLLGLNMCGMILHGPLETFKYFTSWGCWTTLLAFILNMCSAEELRYKDTTWISRAGLLVFEMAFGMEFVITIVYWVFLHRIEDTLFSTMVGILVHSTPILSLLLEFSITRWIFRMKHLVAQYLVQKNTQNRYQKQTSQV